MHPRLEELSEHLDRHRAELRAAVNSVPVEQHATPPAEDAWSVLGVLEHLAIVEGRVGAMLEKQLDTARANGIPLETDASPIVSTLNLARFTDRSRKIKGSDAVQPKAGQTLDELWLTLDATLANVRRVLASSDGLKLTEIAMPHPIFGPLDLYTWFAFIGSHEGRHAAQIREIGATLAQAG